MQRDRKRVFEGPSEEDIRSYYAGMRQFWHPVLPIDELPDDRPMGVELLGEGVVLARLGGEVVAMQDLCRHFQAQLSLGEIVERDGAQCLMCAYHGWAYDESGQCVDIPQISEGRSIPEQARVPRYHATERHGLIWVCMDDVPRFDIPEFPELEDPDFHANALRAYEPWEASAPRVVMGALDDTHFPWVHPGTLGDRSNTTPPDHEVWREGRYLVSQYSVAQPRNHSTAEVGDGSNGSGEAATEEVTYVNYVGMPNTIRLVKSNSAGRYIIWLAAMPNRYDSTTTFWRVARNYDRDPANDPGYEAFEDKVRGQDKPIVESQRPWLLPPFWTKLELPLRPADLPLIEFQRWLEELNVCTAV